jgi:hypothetical protein
MDKEVDSGFGFTLAAGTTSIGYPHIRSVLREPALSAGLKHWDRILSINDYDCQTITHRDLLARLRYAPTGPVQFIIYRPRIDEIVHAKEKSRSQQNTSYTSPSVGVSSRVMLSHSLVSSRKQSHATAKYQNFFLLFSYYYHTRLDFSLYPYVLTIS